MLILCEGKNDYLFVKMLKKLKNEKVYEFEYIKNAGESKIISEYKNTIKYSEFDNVVKIEGGNRRVLRSIYEILKSNISGNILVVADMENNNSFKRKLNEYIEVLKHNKYIIEIEEKVKRKTEMFEFIKIVRKNLRISIILSIPNLETII